MSLYERGYNDYWDGYPFSKLKYSDWQDGWLDAYAEDHIEYYW